MNFYIHVKRKKNNQETFILAKLFEVEEFKRDSDNKDVICFSYSLDGNKKPYQLVNYHNDKIEFIEVFLILHDNSLKLIYDYGEKKC